MRFRDTPEGKQTLKAIVIEAIVDEHIRQHQNQSKYSGYYLKQESVLRRYREITGMELCEV